MSVAVYCKCRIQFVPTNEQRPVVNYSDRSLIELRQLDFAKYSLRGIDVDNNKTEIFNIPFEKGDQYKRGRTADQPDAIRSSVGVFFLNLNAAGQSTFYEGLEACVAELELCAEATPEPPPNDTINTRPLKDAIQVKPVIPNDENDILVDVYKLGQCIRQGDTDGAAVFSKKLAHLRAPLAVNSFKQSKEQPTIKIVIKIDSTDERISNQYKDFSMNVYPSTTVHELRTALEYSKHNLPTNQILFVNGHLAHDKTTMHDLNIQTNSLFVLFIIPS
ncbi:unnamed protein product [Rotaria magnacalcarata]|uniref:Ubiquitin-like domain-containing protein n=1 Tax=Rotaria magnacalcarata TaxID=392030 RepID=A0A815EDS4_9BILA|nr:unnamed protein product [Rotaria magnacalcarata]CAF3961286.1 unnamed protein product [Rotaria magnacalcarata]